MFVRPSRVWSALLWLKTHHTSYSDVRLSRENMSTYSDGEIPVAFFHQKTAAEEPRETVGVSDSSRPSGTEQGFCPLSVHGVTEEDIVSMSFN